MARVALVVIWLGAASMAGVLGFIAYELSRARPVTAMPMSIDKMPSRQPHNRSTRWSVTEHLSAHRVLIAHVETKFLHEAPAIARELTEPLTDRYAEVLIYFHRPGRPDTLAPRRVQWTPAQGYSETVYEKPGLAPGPSQQ